MPVRLASFLPPAFVSVAAVAAVPLAPHAAVVREHVTEDAHTAPAAPAALARAAAPASYTVRPGDTLALIAGRACGDPDDYWALAYNNDVANPDLIYAGQVFQVACQAAAQAIADRYGLTGSSPVSSPVHYVSHATEAPAPSRPAVGTAVVTSVSGTYGCAALEALWEGAGGNPGDAFTAAEVAMAESGGNPNAISPTDDYGLWQVNASNGALATLSPSGSAHSAVVLSDDGTNWGAWTTYRTGAYEGRC